MRLIIFFALVFLTSTVGHTQCPMKVEPPNWWTGMGEDLQLMLYDTTFIGGETVHSDQLTIKDIQRTDNPHYLFVDISLPPNQSTGVFTLEIKRNNQPKCSFDYMINLRDTTFAQASGFDYKDAIYLITPDRFANGDPSNDRIPGLKEQAVDRNAPFGRHGGDIKGIIDHLDYIADYGYTAIWSSPLLINDMPQWSYHGYAITDYYKVDPRFGSLDDYKALAAACKDRGIKLIMDQVANHCGIGHWWMSDLPDKNWINRMPKNEKFDVTNHRRTANQDSYAAASDKLLLQEGWFVPTMPDLNQRHPLLANYLIQNSIWWIETLQLKGIRQDTYPYPDKEFMADWARTIRTVYPNFSIVGEEWSYNPLLIGYWLDGQPNQEGYRSHLTHTMDFAMQQTIIDGLKEPENWNTGFVKIYEGLANDFHYVDPKRLMIFLDNHDMDRLATQLEGDLPKIKMALTLMLSMPRVAQIYYGTEVLLDNDDHPGDHGMIRSDMPGGWTADQSNAFIKKGLSHDQDELYDYLSGLLKLRKEDPLWTEGNVIHFAPKDGIYTLARQDANRVLLFIFKKGTEPSMVDLGSYSELYNGKMRFTFLLDNAQIEDPSALRLESEGVYIIEVTKQ